MTTETAVKTLLILGASGDLTGRLLLPGLARLVARGRADGLTLVGAGSDDWTPDSGRSGSRSPSRTQNSQADAYGKRELETGQDTSSYHRLDVTADGAAGRTARGDGGTGRGVLRPAAARQPARLRGAGARSMCRPERGW